MSIQMLDWRFGFGFASLVMSESVYFGRMTRTIYQPQEKKAENPGGDDEKVRCAH